jgi:hypothetical protein
MLKWIGAGAVLLAAAPIAWAEEPSPPNPVVVPNVQRIPQVSGSAHPAFHGTCSPCHLTVPHSTQAR